MHGTELRKLAEARAAELPGSGMSHPFGANWDVWKIRGKVFMLLTDTTGETIVTLKAAPADGVVLRGVHSDITAGYHMNKRHWITVHPGGSIDPGLLDDLVTESFLLVVEGLPKLQRPVDPDTFGQAEPQDANILDVSEDD